MNMTLEVYATEKITEPGFAGRKLHTHAKPDDLGTVIDLNADGATVRWHRTGTATLVDLGEQARLCDPSDFDTWLTLQDFYTRDQIC